MLSKTIIETVLIIAAEGFWLSFNSSQLRKLLKTHNTKGLSAPNQALNGAGNIAWTTYFASQKLWVPVATNLSMMLITIVTLGYTLGNRKQFLKGLVAILVIGPLTSYLLLTHSGISGWIGLTYNFIAAAPQIVRIARKKKVSGLSERSLYFALAAVLCTFTYALLIKSAPLIASCSIGLFFRWVIMSYYYRYRKRD